MFRRLKAARDVLSGRMPTGEYGGFAAPSGTFVQGTLAARPAPTYIGQQYLATDQNGGTLFASPDGVTWRQLAAGVLQTAGVELGYAEITVGPSSSVIGYANRVDIAGLSVTIGTTRSFTDGATTTGLAVITSPALAAFTQADVGRAVIGAGVPAGAIILSVQNATQATMSANATATASGVTLTVSTSYPGPVVVKFSAPWAGHSLANGVINFHLAEDNVVVDTWHVQSSTASAYADPSHQTRRTSLAAGQHTYKMQWSASAAGTGFYLGGGNGVGGNDGSSSLQVVTC